jgi:hypothetical protein
MRRNKKSTGEAIMKFQTQSISLKDAPIGVVGVSELDVDLGSTRPAKYIVKEKHGSTVFAIRFDAEGHSEERRYPASIKVYPQEL